MKKCHLIIFLLFVCCCDAETDKKELLPEQKEKLKATYSKVLQSTKAFQTVAQDIAKGNIKVADLNTAVLDLCKRTCEAQYFTCSISQMPGSVVIPGLDQRAPREFPIELPECNDPDCTASSSPVSGPSVPDCEGLRKKCILRCNCKNVR